MTAEAVVRAIHMLKLHITLKQEQRILALCFIAIKERIQSNGSKENGNMDYNN